MKKYLKIAFILPFIAFMAAGCLSAQTTLPQEKPSSPAASYDPLPSK